LQGLSISIAIATTTASSTMARPLFLIFLVLNDGGRYDIDHILGTHHEWIGLFVKFVDFGVRR
jgi:hypothetical protein